MSAPEVTHHLKPEDIRGKGHQLVCGSRFVVIHVGSIRLFASHPKEIRRMRQVCNRALSFMDGTMKQGAPEPITPSPSSGEAASGRGDRAG
jgi:hypothetical protein